MLKACRRRRRSNTKCSTKGDNNYMDDIGLGARQKWLNEKHVMGRTVGYLPHVGKATILMNDHPMIKYGLILILGLLVISGEG